MACLLACLLACLYGHIVSIADARHGVHLLVYDSSTYAKAMVDRLFTIYGSPGFPELIGARQANLLVISSQPASMSPPSIDGSTQAGRSFMFYHDFRLNTVP